MAANSMNLSDPTILDADLAMMLRDLGPATRDLVSAPEESGRNLTEADEVRVRADVASKKAAAQAKGDGYAKWNSLTNFSAGNDGGAALSDRYSGQGHRYREQATQYRQNDPHEHLSEERRLWLADRPRPGIPGITDGKVHRPLSAGNVHNGQSAPPRITMPSRGGSGGRRRHRFTSNVVNSAPRNPADNPVRRDKNHILSIARSGDLLALLKAMAPSPSDLREVALLKYQCTRWALQPGPKRDLHFVDKPRELDVVVIMRKSIVDQVLKLTYHKGKDSPAAQKFVEVYDKFAEFLTPLFEVAMKAFNDLKDDNNVTASLRASYDAQYNGDVLDMASALIKIEQSTPAEMPSKRADSPQLIELEPKAVETMIDCAEASQADVDVSSPTESSSSQPVTTPESSPEPSPVASAFQTSTGSLILACTGRGPIVTQINAGFDMIIKLEAHRPETVAATVQAFHAIMDEPEVMAGAIAALNQSRKQAEPATEGAAAQVEDFDEEL